LLRPLPALFVLPRTNPSLPFFLNYSNRLRALPGGAFCAAAVAALVFSLL